MSQTLIGGYPNPRFRDAFNSANGTTAPPLQVERIFVQTQSWGGTPWNEVVTQIKAGRTPIVSTKLTGTWADAAKGSNNTRLDAAVNGLVAQNISALQTIPLFVVHHEPEGDGTPADFNAMQKFMFGRYAAKLRAAGWDIGIITMGGTYMGWTKWTVTQLGEALAGLDVKRVHADVYEKPGETNGLATKPWTDPASPDSPHNKYVAWCKSHNYIPALPEIGVLKHATDKNFQASFLDALAAWSGSESYEYIVYYDRMPGEGGATNNCAIFDVPGALRSYAKLYTKGVVTPPVPVPDDCDEVKAQLAETQAALVESLEELVTVKAELANQETANDNLVTELSKTQGERDAALEKLAQIHTISG